MSKRVILAVLLILWAVPLFAQSVDTAWVRRYNGSGDYRSYDNANAIAVDGSGNAYVTGYSGQSYATIKYYPNGDTAWVRGYQSGSAIAVDDSGNVYVTGGATTKYYPNGDTAWVGKSDAAVGAVAIALDGSGNVLVTGRSYTSETHDDYATIKYDSDGNELWVQRYIGPGNGWDIARAIAVDNSGNVYITGESYDTLTRADYTTIKYDLDGNELWVKRYNGPGNEEDWAYAMAIDESGNVYVTGASHGGGTYYDYATIKYDSSGNELWIRRYNGPVNSFDGASGVAVDGSGNVYVTGKSFGLGTWYDYTTIRYYPNGDTTWVRRHNGQGNHNDEAYAIAVDGSGYVYVTGGSTGSGTDYDYATVTYDSSGNEVWAMRYDGPGNYEDVTSSIAVDDSGNVYVTGYSYGSGTYTDYATIKYVQFLRADVNNDGDATMTDIIYLIDYLFRSGSAPIPILQVGDVNCDENVNIVDAVYLINYLFKGGPAPCI